MILSKEDYRQSSGKVDRTPRDRNSVEKMFIGRSEWRNQSTKYIDL